MIKQIRNLKISLKLYILVGVALIGMLVIGGISFILMGRLNEKTSDISTSWLPSVDTARDMTATISNIRLNELGYLTAVSDEIAKSSLQYVEKEKGDMEELLATYEGLIDKEERGFYDTAREVWTQYSQADDQLMELAKQGRIEEARSILDGECAELYNSLNMAFDEIVAYNEQGSAEETDASARLYRNATMVQVGIMIVVILIGVFFSFVIIRGIKLPIFEIEKAASKMAQGDLDVNISYTSKDELGVLSDQVRNLIQKLQLIIDDENKFLRSEERRVGKEC